MAIGISEYRHYDALFTQSAHCVPSPYAAISVLHERQCNSAHTHMLHTLFVCDHLPYFSVNISFAAAVIPALQILPVDCQYIIKLNSIGV